MTEQELKAALSRIRDQMLNDDDDELSGRRQSSLDRYLGEPYGHEREGRSRYVTREVMEAIEWALPSLLRIFTAGDRVVCFEPVGPDDEELAEQETDLVNHYLLKENNGFMAFYEWFKDALMYPNGYAKIWTEEVKKVTTEMYSGVTEMGLAAIDADPYREIVEATETQTIISMPQGPVPITVYDLKVKYTKTVKKLRFESVPPEQVGVDADLSSLSLDEARAVVHRSQRTKSYLIEAGYDRELLDSVSQDEEEDWGTERVNRMDGQDDFNTEDNEVDDSQKLYWLEEWYIKVDYDGDGIAEARKIDVIGGEIFENIEYDYQPMIALSAIPLTHRHAGLSLADLVAPIQELSTYLQRAINDNISQIKDPRRYVGQNALMDDGSTMDALLDPKADIIPVRDPSLIVPEIHAPVIQELLAVRQTIADQSQLRTGVAPNMALNADTLQRSTADAYSTMLNKANERIEMIARIFAETGVRDAMLKAHRQVKEHQDIPKAVKIRGKWIESNPSDWQDRENVTVNVGLGFGSKDQQLVSAQSLLAAQQQALQIGMATPQNIYNALEDFVEALGRKSVERYFTLPQPTPPQEQQPDPVTQAQVQLAGAQAQAVVMDQKRKQQESMAKNQRESAKLDAELENKNADTQKKLADAAKASFEAGSAIIQQQAEALSGPFGSDL